MPSRIRHLSTTGSEEKQRRPQDNTEYGLIQAGVCKRTLGGLSGYIGKVQIRNVPKGKENRAPANGTTKTFRAYKIDGGI